MSSRWLEVPHWYFKYQTSSQRESLIPISFTAGQIETEIKMFFLVEMLVLGNPTWLRSVVSSSYIFFLKRISHEHITRNTELYILWEDFCSLLKELTNLASRSLLFRNALLSQTHLQRHRQEDDEALRFISITLMSRYRIIDLLNFRQQINKMPTPPDPPKKKSAESIYTISSKWVGRSFHRTAEWHSAVMKTWVSAAAHCISMTQLCCHSVESVRGTPN